MGGVTARSSGWLGARLAGGPVRDWFGSRRIAANSVFAGLGIGKDQWGVVYESDLVLDDYDTQAGSGWTVSGYEVQADGGAGVIQIVGSGATGTGRVSVSGQNGVNGNKAIYVATRFLLRAAPIADSRIGGTALFPRNFSDGRAIGVDGATAKFVGGNLSAFGVWSNTAQSTVDVDDSVDGSTWHTGEFYQDDGAGDAWFRIDGEAWIALTGLASSAGGSKTFLPSVFSRPAAAVNDDILVDKIACYAEF